LHRHGHRNYLEDYTKINNSNIKCKKIFFGPKVFLDKKNQNGTKPFDSTDFQYILNNPDYFIPVFNGKDENKNYSEFKNFYNNLECERAQLTDKGIDLMYEFGKSLFKTYCEEKNFISKHFNPNEFQFRAVHKSRMIESLMALIVGLYPENFNFLSNDIKKVEINLWRQEDNMSRHHCEKSSRFKQLENNFDMIFSEKYNEKCQKAFRDFKVSKPENKNLKEGIYYLHDNIKCLVEHGETQFDEIAFKNLEYLSMQSSFGVYFNSKEAAILRIGDFLENDIYRVFSSEIDRKKFYIYSASDDTIASTLVIFDLLNKKMGTEWPQFGSHIIFELYEDEKKNQFVFMKYGASTTSLNLDAFKSKLMRFEN
jgi:hypothetical protein